MAVWLFVAAGLPGVSIDGSAFAGATKAVPTADLLNSIGIDSTFPDRGQPLDSSGKLVNSAKMVVDGPFAEAKDVIGGYTLIKAKDLAAAAELAKGCPLLARGGGVEVRPVLKM